MQPTPGFAAPVALGSLSAPLYPSTIPVAAWLGNYGPLCALLAAEAWRKTLRPTPAPLAVRRT